MKNALTDWIGPDECALILGLLLVAIGAWLAWRPAGFLVPGAVILWIALPERASFIVRAPDAKPSERKKVT